MRKLTLRQIATIVKLRGLGFSQKEIAERIGEITPSAISYQLKRIKGLAEKEGVDQVFKHYLHWMFEEAN